MRISIKIRFLNLFICFFFLISLFLLILVNVEIKILFLILYKYVNDYVNLINEVEVNKIIFIGKELEDKIGV